MRNYSDCEMSFSTRDIYSTSNKNKLNTKSYSER